MTEFHCDTCRVTVLSGGAVWVTNDWLRATLRALARGEEPMRARWRVGCEPHAAPPDGDNYDLTIREASRADMLAHLARKPWARFTVWPRPGSGFGLSEQEWAAVPLELREAS